MRLASALVLAPLVACGASDSGRGPGHAPVGTTPGPAPARALPVASAASPTAPALPHAKGKLTVAEARTYMVELLNRDRATQGLPPLELDLGAPTRAGQAHAEDLARLGYLGHWGSDGSVPEERHTREGGADMVLENASCFTDERPRTLDPAPLIDRDRVEQAERMFFDEVPPNDGHRKNILKPAHNRIGIGIAQPIATETELPVPCFSQELVDHHGTYDAVPASARVGDPVRVAGKLAPPWEVTAVGLARIEPPKALAPSVLNQRRSYPVPRPYELFWKRGFVTRIPLEIGPGGAFSIATTLDDKRQPGLYEISVWGKVPGGEHVMLGLRTIRVD